MTTETQIKARLPATAMQKPLREETEGWPDVLYFVRTFTGGVPELERFLNLAPDRVRLVTLHFNAVGTPIGLFNGA